MRYSILTASVISLAGIAGAVDTNRKSCEANGPWMTPVFGGVDWSLTPDGEKFCEAGYSDGDVLTGIKVWKAAFQVHAIKLRWGNHDYGRMYGTTDEDRLNSPDATVEWDPSTPVNIRLWENEPDDHQPMDAVGRLRIEVQGKDAVEVGANKGKVGKERNFETGSGLILAAAGASGAWISTLQFYYLKSKIVNAALTKVNFEDSLDKYNQQGKSEKERGIIPAVIGNLYIKNSNPEGGANQTYSLSPKIEKQMTKSVKTSMSHTVGTTLGFKVTTEVGLPELISSTTEFSTELRYDFTYLKEEGTSQTDVFSFTWNIGSTPQGIPPQTAMHCTATAKMGTFDSKYTGKVTAYLDNGETFEYNDSGEYKSIAYADAASDCGAVPLSEIPSDADIQEANGKLPSAKRATIFRA